MLMRSKAFRQAALALAISAPLLLAGCESTDDGGDDNGVGLQLSLNLPNSLTGGQAGAGAARTGQAGAHQGGEPCAFIGPEDDDDPLRNGYEMSKFMISAVATWTCIADLLIDIADVVAHDAVIHATDNNPSSPGYDDDDPTHYSVSDDTSTQTTIRMWYGFDHATPPTIADDAGFYLSWHTEANGDVRGKLVISAAFISESTDPDDPTAMRMDFVQTGNQKFADMFLRFDENEWAEGFRIEVTNDLTANPLEQVYTARGLIGMNAQFAPVPDISELPDIRMYTVADRLGDGAAIALVEDISLPLVLNETSDNHLGNYLFTKTDRYFFEADQDWDWIDKQVTAAVYRGARTTPATGGSWDPFDPSLDLIRAALLLDNDYFTASKCANVNDNCVELLNAIFDDGFADQEPNQGSDPMDWRSTAIANADFLDSVYPNGLNWDGAFDMTFTP